MAPDGVHEMRRLLIAATYGCPKAAEVLQSIYRGTLCCPMVALVSLRLAAAFISRNRPRPPARTRCKRPECTECGSLTTQIRLPEADQRYDSQIESVDQPSLFA